MKKFFLSILCIISIQFSQAEEGMWLPTLLDKYTIDEMHQMGFKLSSEDIYSINQNSMKDAVVIFGKGCTGEMISNEGLLLTNHHCGHSFIQSHSSLQHDYLTDGFWAKSREEELSNPGLTAKFLDHMEDVTDSVLVDTQELQGFELSDKIQQNIWAINRVASDSGKFETVVKPLYNGNQYFLYVYKVFKDVRLVGAPPSSIGKFGGDTDNWMWPRHTGDFSIFRVYADNNNEPADYSPDNIPYQPKKFFTVSKAGIKKGDFIMVLGYPGSTQQYLSSFAIDLLMNQSDPDKIRIRSQKLEVLEKHMKDDPEVRIQYASKYARTSNSWKRWKGEIKGLKRLNAISKKQEFEKDFQQWCMSNDSLQSKYSEVLGKLEKLHIDLFPFERAYNYYDEIIFQGIDILKFASNFPRSTRGWERAGEVHRDLFKQNLKREIRSFFKDYNQATDEEVFVTLLRLFRKDLPRSFQPDGFIEMMQKYDDDKLLKKIYRKSILSDQKKMEELVDGLDLKKLRKIQKDPLFKLYSTLRSHYRHQVETVYASINQEIEKQRKIYMAGILSMNAAKERLYPDANFTFRLAYGKVEGYQPSDAVSYRYYTTLKGVMEKDNPEVYDYDVPQKLRDVYQQKDFGDYSEENYMPLAFIASAHTTGGNSGSPAINGNGELVGLNFDRCWEGTMSDIMFDPDQCRNIMLDIRYVLFIIDKFAGAGYLIDEMNLVN